MLSIPAILGCPSVFEKSERTIDHAHCDCGCKKEDVVVDSDAKFILFATKTCPKCKIAAQLLEKKGIAYEKLFVEENVELAKELELKQAPTLVIQKGDVAEKIADLPAIKDFIESL